MLVGMCPEQEIREFSEALGSARRCRVTSVFGWGHVFSGEEAIFTVLKMGKTLEECYEVLGLDSSASEGKFKVRQVLCAFVKTKCGVLDWAR